MRRLHAPSTWRGALRWGFVVPALAALMAACGGGGDGEPTAAERAALCRAQVNATADQLLSCVTVEAVQAHIAKFTEIALANGGSREAGTAAYEATVAYVEGLLREAGYTVTVQPFSYENHELAAPSVLEQRVPAGAAIAHDVMRFSGSGDVTAAVATPAVPMGCNASDFAGFPGGSIALVLRGECLFSQKATNALQAGAVAMVVYSHEEVPLLGDLGEDFRLPLPVLGITHAAGERLLAQVAGGLVLHLQVQATRKVYTTVNLLAETPGGDPAQVVMAGAHLDTMPGTVGSNDNGSGTAALLETALQMARVAPRNKVRFVFWGAEEAGDRGSNFYVTQLTDAERAGIALYLNFDMIASPNFFYGVFAGNGQAEDDSPLAGTAAATLQAVFTGYYERLGLPWRIAEGLEGRSDHAAFSRAGIAHGGIFTGAEKIKTEQDAALWGGTAGIAFDACYHQPCDNMTNLNLAALAVNADLVAAAVLHFAMNALTR